MARNMEVGSLGFTPQQIVFGQGSEIPGITDGNIATDAMVCDSEHVWLRMKQLIETRDIYRETDRSERIKKILAQKTIAFLHIMINSTNVATKSFSKMMTENGKDQRK